MDGISLTRTLRDRDVAIPILMLTARDGIDDRVDGLRSGADDYLIKPFAFDELLARVDALARRSHGGPSGAILRHGAVTLDPRSAASTSRARRWS
jgi:DNA-binding response OmpR family regulator